VPAWKILVVDDDPDIRRIAALALERLGGFRVLLAASSEEALELAAGHGEHGKQGEAPDLVLLDVTMPGMDGPATLGALRANAATAHVPVVFFTATSNDADVARLCALGAVGVIAKPFDIAELSRRVTAFLSSDGSR
jgi:CheY-like chemotaxis protein